RAGRLALSLLHLGGDGVVDGLVNGEDLRQPGDLEHLEDAALCAHEEEVAIVAAQPLETTDEHAQPGGVEEVDAFEVDDDAVLALADQLDQLLPETRRGVDVDFSLHGQHRVRRMAVVDVEPELHTFLLLATCANATLPAAVP